MQSESSHKRTIVKFSEPDSHSAQHLDLNVHNITSESEMNLNVNVKM